jgi:shikimate dehydrogenase
MALSRVGLIGDPVAHSRSPAMHNAAFAHLHIDARYERWHTPAAELAARVASLRAADVLGANVTLPHKAAVLPFLDDIEPEAANIGAVNTIYKRADGALVGANTDAPALLDALREEGGFEPADQSVVLLGASGAARAAAYALVGAGVQRLVVANRTPERAEELLSDVLVGIYGGDSDEDTDELVRSNGRLSTDAPLHPEMRVPQLVALALDDADLHTYIAESPLLINATSLGWHADETPLPNPPVVAGTLVYDMVYRPTRLLHEAAAQGARTLDGLGMLVRQGALAFSRWTGRDAPLDVMYAALQTA